MRHRTDTLCSFTPSLIASLPSFRHLISIGLLETLVHRQLKYTLSRRALQSILHTRLEQLFYNLPALSLRVLGSGFIIMAHNHRRFSALFGLSALSVLLLILLHLTGNKALGRLRYAFLTPPLESWSHIEVAIPADNRTWPYRVFKSSQLRPPNLSVSINHVGATDGYLFLTSGSRGTIPGQEQAGPYIITSDNELIYAYQSGFTPLRFNGLRVQTIDGQEHLTFWRGETIAGYGYGELILLDNEYVQSNMDLGVSIRRRPEFQRMSGNMDFHEQEITARGTVIVTAYNETLADLSALGGPENGSIVDSMFFEVDLNTHEVLFSWSARDHLPLSTSHYPLGADSADKALLSFDWFHINSIQLVGRDFLISSRHNWAIYLVSGDDGHIIWTLSGDGAGGDFGPLPPSGQFRWQHDARAHYVSENTLHVSLFDNHCRAAEECTTASQGIVLELDLPPISSMAPRVLCNVRSDDQMIAKSQGSFQTQLRNDNQLLSYGPSPVIREFGPPEQGSKLLWESRFGYDDSSQSYRVYKSLWYGKPREWDPVLAIVKQNSIHASGLQLIHAHVSWNGATHVQKWNVYIGHAPGEKRRLVGSARRRGFETVFELLVSTSGCVHVAAVEAGEEVRSSNVVCLQQ